MTLGGAAQVVAAHCPNEPTLVSILCMCHYAGESVVFSRYVTSHLGQLSLPSIWGTDGLRRGVFTCVGW